MAIVQSDWAAGRKQGPVSGCAGDVVAQRYYFKAPAALVANDIIELAPLSGYHTIIDATLLADNLAGATLDVGIMSGTYGSPDQARTCGNELFAGAAVATVVRMSKASGFLLTPVDADRGIGVKLLGAGMAKDQLLTLIVYSIQ